MLKVFGDSFSALYRKCSKEVEQSRWFTIISRTLNKPLLNVARAGATNQYILNTLLEQLPSITGSDTVIINITGQGRLPIGANSMKSWFNDQDFLLSMDTGVKILLSKNSQAKIQWYYDTLYLPEIVENDKTINNIIELANHIDKKIGCKVILWNLTSLGTPSDLKYNDNVGTSPSIPLSTLWTPSSKLGTVGWVSIMADNRMNISPEDLHPNKSGHRYIAKEFLNTLKGKSIL